jgi:hypothetical protein
MSVKMPVRIPGGIEPRHLAQVREIMEDCLRGLSKFEVMQVNLRLNKSGTEERLPYFIDWVGVEDVIRILKRDETRDIDPGLLRFGDNTPSLVNQEALDGALKTIINKDWKTRGFSEKRPESRVLAQKANVMYQKIIGIIAKDQSESKTRCVGTFTAGLKEEPKETAKIDEELKRIAGWTTPPASELVRWIEQNLVLGGPFK